VVALAFRGRRNLFHSKLDWRNFIQCYRYFDVFREEFENNYLTVLGEI
jgi:hypothetical protein